MALAGETGERKGQAVGERKQRVEDGERNEQKKCNIKNRETRGDEKEGAGKGKQRDAEKEAERHEGKRLRDTDHTSRPVLEGAGRER